MSGKDLIGKLKGGVKDFFAHWNTPPKEGYCLSNKEFLAYSVGGMGVKGFEAFIGIYTATLGINLAYVYNFEQRIIMYTTWIIAVLSLLRAPIIGWIVDNTKTKFGKYRPHLLWAGIVSLVLYVLLAIIPNLFMPKAGEEYTELKKWLVCGSYQAIFFLANTAHQFFVIGRQGLSQVITPNTQERTKLYSIGGIIESFGPTVINFMYPLLATFFYGKGGLKYGKLPEETIAAMGDFFGVKNIRTFQIILPVLGIICILITLIMFFGTKERIIEKKNDTEKVKFLSGIAQSFKNKYFWLMSISNVVAFARLTLFSTGLLYVCDYMVGGDLGGYMRGIAPTLTALGFAPGMLIAPLIINKIGKRNTTLISFLGSIVMAIVCLFFILFAYDASYTPYMIFIAIFVSNFFNAFFTVTSCGMTADYCDYQQWKTGKRMDAYLTQFSASLLAFFGIVTSLFLTWILKVGGAVDSSDFANPGVMKNVMLIYSGLAIGSGLLAMVPLFFWDLTETKQKKMTLDLKMRAYASDIENNVLAPENVLEAIELGVLTDEKAVELGFDVEGLRAEKLAKETANVEPSEDASTTACEETGECDESANENADDVSVEDVDLSDLGFDNAEVADDVAADNSDEGSDNACNTQE